jgi:phage shock protein E
MTKSDASQKAHQMVSAGAALIDVRTPAEYAAGHIEGARNIPVQELAQRLSEVGPKETPVVLYCKSGARSEMAAQMLRQAGWREVFNLGGMTDW